MKKGIIRNVCLFLFANALLFSACTKNEVTPDESKTPTGENETAPAFVGADFTIELGKSQKETPVRVLASDDAIYIVGHTEADYGEVNDFEDFNGGYYDLYITKMSTLGEVQWEKCFGSKLSEKAVDAQLTEDGGLLVTGNESQIFYGGGGLGPLVGSSDVVTWKISSEGEIEWRTKALNNNSDEVAAITTIVDNSLMVFYTEVYDKGIYYYTVSLDDGSVGESKKIDIDKYNPQVRRIKKLADGSYFIVCISHLVKLNASMQMEWNTTTNGACFDIAETTDGYLAVGSTTKSQFSIGNNNRYPYYRVIHDPVTKGSEVFLLKLNKQGEFKCTRWTGGNGNNVDNIGWQIGVGYLESGWAKEYLNLNFQPDGGVFVKMNSEDDYLIIGNGTHHSNGDGVTGAGEYGKPEAGLLTMNINPNYKMKDNKKDDVYITWEKEFYANVLLKKNFFETTSNVIDVLEVNGLYLILSNTDENIKMSVLLKSAI